MRKGIIKRLSYLIPVRAWREGFRAYLSLDFHQAIKVQNKQLNKELKNTKNLIMFLVPECNVISGGIMSIFSLAKNSRRFKDIHDSEVIIATIPNEAKATYAKQTFFRNDETVFRFSQITKFKNLENLIIHIPEYASKDFYNCLSLKVKTHLSSIKNLKINIMNQNINLMPEKKDYADLYRLTDIISQTVAHHRYATQKICDKFQLPTLFLQAYTDLSEYKPSAFEEKENIIAYSHDQNKYKQAVLKRIADELPDFKLIEIENLVFDEYMELITTAKFTITFGEGYDGYLAQPFFQCGVSFAVYNDKFFPSPEFRNYLNILNSYEDMIENIVNIIKDLNANSDKYKRLNEEFMIQYNKLYNFDEYLSCIKKFYMGNIDFYPQKAKSDTSIKELV